MSLADQWKQEGFEQGTEQRNYEIARKLLQKNLDEHLVAESTGLSFQVVLQIKKEIKI